MDAPLYDVYLTGKLADDISPAVAAQRLAALFKSTPEAMAGLITGKVQLLKRGVDKNTALKYREALQKAGCEVAFKAQTATTATDTKPAANLNPQVSSTATTAPQPAPNSTHSAPASGLQLAPAGAELLRADERQTSTPVEVDTAHLSLAPVGPLPTFATAPMHTPEISHLSLAAAGGNLLQDSEKVVVPAIAPDISGLSLAAAGTPIETLKNEMMPVSPDTSGLALAPAGSDILAEEERRHPQSPPPNTDHLTLAP